MDTNPTPPLMTTKEACHYLKIGKTTFFRLLRERKLRRIDIGHGHVTVADLDAYIASKTQ